MEPILSVIITTYNIVEKDKVDDFNLLITLLSKQTYPEIEIIVIDKASTDETNVLLKDYKNKGYINFFSEPDMNKFDGFNKGVMRAHGKYVAFLSCDDFWHDITAVRDIMTFMESNNADFVYSPAYCCYPTGYVYLFPPVIHAAFQVMPCARQGMIFKKSVIEQLNYFDTKFAYFADFDLIIRMLMKRFKGFYYDTNFTTYKLCESIEKNPEKCTQECKQIFYKNYRGLTALNNDILDKMVKTSEFPQELLQKLAVLYPPEERQQFLNDCEEVYKNRVEAVEEAASLSEQQQT